MPGFHSTGYMAVGTTSTTITAISTAAPAPNATDVVRIGGLSIPNTAGTCMTAGGSTSSEEDTKPPMTWDYPGPYMHSTTVGTCGSASQNKALSAISSTGTTRLNIAGLETYQAISVLQLTRESRSSQISCRGGQVTSLGLTSQTILSFPTGS